MSAPTATPASLEGFASIPLPKPIGPVAYRGIAGEYIHLVEPHTEADPNLMLVYFLCATGNLIGHGPYVVAGGDRHYCNLYICAVGSTARGRKGSATGPVESLLKQVDPAWRVKAGGLSSGEGLIDAVRDRREPKKGQEPDEGITDKRLFVRQSEFYGALQNMKRSGNNLSATMREAWDRGELDSMTVTNRMHATDAHISIVAGITAEELRRSLTDEIDNGFANRFLWVHSTRSKLLPSGGHFFDLDLTKLRDRLCKVIDLAKGQTRVPRDSEAEDLWGHDESKTGMYVTLNRDRPGLFGVVTARAAPQVLRLALIYSQLDEKSQISVKHLQAAHEVWRYCEESARYIFGEALQNDTANEILAALRREPNGITRTAMSSMIFHGHKTTTDIETALTELARMKLAYRKDLPPGRHGGRPAECWLFAK
jgi:hypothetical protein